jgi:phage gp29-like protein
LGSIADVLNRQGVSTLAQLNGIPRNLWPKFTPGDIEKEDVVKFCDNIYKLVGVGALVPDQDVQDKIRELLGLPVKVSDGSDFIPEPKPFITNGEDGK